MPPSNPDPTSPTPPDAPPARGGGPKIAAQTERLYAGDWAAFADWACATGQPALPAAAETIAAYLEALAGRLGPGSLGRRLAAIGHHHRQQGLPAPSPGAVRTARRRHSNAPQADTYLPQARRRPRPRSVPSPQRLVRLTERCPGDLAGLRDRALLLLAAAGLDRKTLVGLDVEQLRFGPDAMELRCGDGTRRIGRSAIACPVRAVADWLEVSDTRFGPVFRKVDRWGNVEHHRLGADALRRIVLRRTPRREKAE